VPNFCPISVRERARTCAFKIVDAKAPVKTPTIALMKAKGLTGVCPVFRACHHSGAVAFGAISLSDETLFPASCAHGVSGARLAGHGIIPSFRTGMVISRRAWAGSDPSSCRLLESLKRFGQCSRLETSLQLRLGDCLTSPQVRLSSFQWPEQRRQRTFLASVERVFATHSGNPLIISVAFRASNIRRRGVGTARAPSGNLIKNLHLQAVKRSVGVGAFFVRLRK
jgi:hypothetical protein